MAGLTDVDRDHIRRARDAGHELRVRGSDLDRLAGWLLAELADLAERLAADQGDRGTLADLAERQAAG